jgi:carbon dioxide concentrating mechanism protein CcmL
MRIARVLGSVTLSRQHPSLVGGALRLAIPLSHAELVEAPDAAARGLAGDTLIVWDDLAAANGSLIAVSEGAEAAQPFRPNLKPIDAYNADILDNVHLP